MQFPTTESNIQSLALKLGTGLMAHGPDFPNLDLDQFNTANTAYIGSISQVEDTKAAYRSAILNKKQKLNELIEIMRADFKQAEIDCIANPANLYEIGWAPRATPTPQAPPEQANNFTAAYQGPGSIIFTWDRPTSGGKVTNYIIERRIGVPSGETGEFGPWLQVYTSFKTDVELFDQPRGEQLEYRVTASNPAGQAVPSNTVPVVL